MSSARQLINTVHVDMLISSILRDEETNNRLVYRTRPPMRAFYFAFPSPCGRTSIHKIAIQLV